MNKLAIDIGQQFGSPFGQTLGLADLVSVILSNAVVFAGIIVLILIIIGGFGIIISAGSDNPESAAKGRKAATAALIGFLIVFAAYWIIRIVEIITNINILNSPL